MVNFNQQKLMVVDHISDATRLSEVAVGKLEEICSFVLREAEKKGADYCETYGVSNKESEVFIENND